MSPKKVIYEITNEKLIIPHLKSKNKLGVIEELSERLHREKCLTDKKLFIKNVLQRENDGMTLIGNGMAMPHSFSDLIKKTTLAIGISDSSIEWEPIPEGKVHFILLIAISRRDKERNELIKKILMYLRFDQSIVNGNGLDRLNSTQSIISLLKKGLQ